MKEIQMEDKSLKHKTFLNEISKTIQYTGLENYFELEAELFDYIYQLEKEEAQKVARQIVKELLNQPNEEKLRCVYYFLVTLSTSVTRYLAQNRLTVSQAIAFSDTCRRILDKGMTKENVSYLADELIEFFMYVLIERTPPTLKHDTVNSVIIYIDDEVKSALTVEGIANEFNISTSHLSRIFHEHTSITLVEYINVRKVEEAQYHLRFSNYKISDISDSFNFCNQSYFTRIFKKYTGETPRRFRHSKSVDYFKLNIPLKENDRLDGESL